MNLENHHTPAHPVALFISNFWKICHSLHALNERKKNVKFIFRKKKGRLNITVTINTVLCGVASHNFTNVSGEPVASVFRVEVYPKFGDSRLRRNVRRSLPIHRTLYPIEHFTVTSNFT